MMTKRRVLRAVSLLAAVFVLSGCGNAASKTIEKTGVQTVFSASTENISKVAAELEVDYIDELGLIHYKNPTDITYEQIYQKLKINGLNVDAPLTIEKFGQDFNLCADSIEYIEEENVVCAEISYKGNVFANISIKDCQNEKDFNSKEIILIVVLDSLNDENIITVSNIGIGSKREEVISEFGIPYAESVSDNSGDTMLTYGNENSMLSFSCENGSVQTILIGFEL